MGELDRLKTVDADIYRNSPFHEKLRIPLARPWFDATEPEAVAEVVRSGQLCQGAVVARFEAAFAEKLGVKQAIAVSNGSIALLIALQALGVRAGDEVIVPDMTFISTATCAMYLGARPVFGDIRSDNYCLDASKIEPLVSSKTRVILPVHYAGQTADMAELQEIAAVHGLHVVEDAAEAHLARYRGGQFAGTIGDIGIFSFTPTKPMTTGEGGMLVTNSDDLADKCRAIRNFGDHGKFDWRDLGFNFRMTEMQAAIGICQLAKLDAIIAARQSKAARYDAAFANEEAIMTPHVRMAGDCNYQLYTIRFDADQLDIQRDQIIDALAERGVASRLYYPALHRSGVFEDLGTVDDRRFPETCRFEATALSLPIFTALTEREQDYVADNLLDIVRRHRR